jgi:hypothetical protein
MKSKKIIIISLVVLVLIPIAAAIFILRKPAVSENGGAPTISRKEMENIAMVATASFGFPKMMDADARAEGVSVTDDNLFQIFVTLVTVNTEKEGHEAVLARIKNSLPGSACDQRSVKFLLFKGITVKFSFKSDDGKELFDYVIKPGICPE